MLTVIWIHLLLNTRRLEGKLNTAGRHRPPEGRPSSQQKWVSHPHTWQSFHKRSTTRENIATSMRLPRPRGCTRSCPAEELGFCRNVADIHIRALYAGHFNAEKLDSLEESKAVAALISVKVSSKREWNTGYFCRHGFERSAGSSHQIMAPAHAPLKPPLVISGHWNMTCRTLSEHPFLVHSRSRPPWSGSSQDTWRWRQDTSWAGCQFIAGTLCSHIKSSSVSPDQVNSMYLEVLEETQ